MKHILTKRLLLVLILTGLFALVTAISVPNIRLNMSIHNLFPYNEELNTTLKLTENSTISRKVLLFIQADDTETLKEMIPLCTTLIEESNLAMQSTIPDGEQITDFISYIETNALLLYPSEWDENPFTSDAMQKRISDKEEYLFSLPFMNPGPSFFHDPLMLQGTVFKLVNNANGGKFNPQMGGLISEDGTAWMQVLHTEFLPEDYESSAQVASLDKKINKLGNDHSATAFLFGASLYYNESQKKTMREIIVIFIVSIILTLLVFYYFYRRLDLLLYGFMPIFGGFALTFLSIALFFKEYGGIAFAFGATTSGIAIDYTIHYLTKRSLYPTLKELRKKIGFSMFLGFITTIASFMFLLFSNILSLKQISLFGLLTISFAFLIAWFVLQPLIPPGKPAISIRTVKFPVPGRKALIGWFIVMILLLIPLPFLKFEDNVLNLDRRHTTLTKRLEMIKTSFIQSTDSVFISFSGADRDRATAKSLVALQAISQEKPELSFFTPAILAPDRLTIESRKEFIKAQFNNYSFNRAVDKSIFSEESFEPFTESVQNLSRLELTDLPDYLQSEIDAMYVTLDNRVHLLVPVTDRDNADAIVKFLSEKGIDHLLVDSLRESAAGLVAFEKNALILLAASLLIILIILTVAYRNILYALSALLPAIAALIASLSVAIITMRAINIMHITAAILLLGIGVDYGIFMTTVYSKKGNKLEKSATIQSIFISGLTTLAGFGVLVFCGNLSVFSLGSGMFSGIIAAFITAWWIIPRLQGTDRKGARSLSD